MSNSDTETKHTCCLAHTATTQTTSNGAQIRINATTQAGQPFSIPSLELIAYLVQVAASSRGELSSVGNLATSKASPETFAFSC